MFLSPVALQPASLFTPTPKVDEPAIGNGLTGLRRSKSEKQKQEHCRCCGERIPFQKTDLAIIESDLFMKQT